MKRFLSIMLACCFTFFAWAQDDCGTAVVIAAGSHATAGPTAGGGASPTCATGATNAKWFSYTASVTGTATVESTSGGDTRLNVHSGACGSLVCVGNNDDGGTGTLSLLTFNVCSGTTYYIEWDDRWNNAALTFDVTETASCADPSTASIVPTTDGFDATTTWTAGGGACGGGYEWEIVANGAAAFAGNDIQSGTGAYPVSLAAVTGLTSGTNYDLYVRDVCGGSFSANILTNFTTLPLTLPETCADAIAIGAGSYTAPAPNSGNGASPTCATGATHASWYAYTAGVTGTATVTSTAGGDTRLNVHSGTCAALVCVGNNDDGGVGTLSSLTFNVCSGTVYYIEWDDRWNNAAIDFTVTETATCADPGTATLSTTTDGYDASTTWAAGGGACGGGFEWEIVADGAAAFAGNDIQSGTGAYPVSLAAVTGLASSTDYDLYVRDVCGGSFSANVLTNFTTATPGFPGSCATAQVITAGSHSAPGPSSGGGASPTCATGATNANWYSYTPSITGTATVESTLGGDTRLNVHSGSCGSLVCVGNNDDGGTGTLSLLTFNICAGTTYYIEWDDRWASAALDFDLTETAVCADPSTATITTTTDGYDATTTWTAGGGACGGGFEWEIVADGAAAFAGNDIQSGTGAYPVSLAAVTGLTAGTNYDLYVRDVCGGSFSSNVLTNFTTLPLSLPETCADAIAITAGSHSAPGPASGGGASPTCATGATNASWYAYTAGITGTATVESTAGGDTRLNVHSGTCAALVCVGNNDDGGVGTLSSLSFPVCAGTVYYIEWDDRWNNAAIDFDVTETASCANPGTASITETLDGFDGTTTWTAGGGDCGGTYEWEIVANGAIPFAGNDIQSGSGSYPVSLAAVTGLASSTDYDFYTRDNCGGGSLSSAVLTNFTTLTPPPVNDDCADAIVVFSGYTVTGFSTNGATGTDITSCVLNDVASVWFSYTPTCNTTVQVNTNGSTYDTGLSVFDACGGTELDCDDDGGTGLQSLVSFAATSGTTYLLRVAGYNGATGDINFSVIETTPCPCATNVWTGANGTDWNDTLNWSCNVAPTSACGGGTDDVIIPAGSSVTPIVTGTLGVGNLEIATGAAVQIDGVLEVCGNVVHNGNPMIGVGNVELTGTAPNVLSGTGSFANINMNNANGASVMAGADLGVTNSLVLTAGAFTNGGTFNLVSSATGTAYLDDFSPGTAGTYVGDITVQRYVTAGFGLGQRYFGSAVTSGSVSGLNGLYTTYPLGQLIPDGCDPTQLDAASPYSNLFEWHEDATFATGCNQEGWFAISAAAPLTNGRGYSGWMDDASVLSVTGAPNSGPQSYGPLTNTASGVASVEGWHLLSNPFPSPMNVDAVTDDGFTSPQYYNATSGAFSGTYQPMIVAGSEVPVMQGFVAHTTGGHTFAPDNTDRIASNNANFFKSNDWFDYKLEVVVEANGNADITYLYYSDYSTDQFDNASDCVKRRSDTNKPTLYTKMGMDELSLNGLHLSDLGTSIPMGLIAPEDATYTFSFSGDQTFPANTSIYLEDLATGTYHEVTTGDYTFTANVADNGTDRFMIHFVLPASFNLIDPSCENTVGTLVDLTNDNRVFEMSTNGNVVESGNLSGQSVELTHGDYEVEVFDQFGGSQLYPITVAEIVSVDVDIAASNTEIFEGDMVDFNYNGQGANDFEWYINGQLVASTELLEYTFTAAGDYLVELYASNESCNASAIRTYTVIEKVTSIINIGEEASLNIFSENENVAIAFTNVKADEAEVAVYNLIGQNMISQTVEAEGTQIVNNVNWPNTYYIVKVTIEGQTYSSTLLLSK